MSTNAPAAQVPAVTTQDATIPKGPANREAAAGRVTLRALFEQQRPELTSILPPGMTPDRLFRMALTECVKNPKLLECSAESWALALQTCGAQGLYPDSQLGYMWLIPRKNKKKLLNGREEWVDEVTAQRGYQGDIKLARNSGEIETIFAEVVYKRDVYKVTKGLNPTIVHEPFESEEEKDEPGPLRAAYAVAKLKSGEVIFVTLSKRDVMRHKAASKGTDSEDSPWRKHEAAMWKKSAIRELFKWLPKSTERAEAVARQLTDEAPIDITALSAASVPTAPKLSGLEGLTASLPEPAAPEGPKKDCPHEAVPPSKVEALEPGATVVCPDCGEEFTKPREPGDDAEDPKAAVGAVAAAADKGKPKQGRLA